jgi:carbon monoxide dehydrogenase subunit G
MTATIRVSSVIPAPVERVWAIWNQPERIPEWIPAVKSVRRVGHKKEGIGAEIEFTSRNAWRTITYRTRVSRWEEGRLVQSDIVPGSGSGAWTSTLDHQTTEWRFEPEDGSTRITATQEMKLKGPLDLLSAPWLWVFDRQLYRRAFRKLAELCAREPGDTGPEE